MTGLGVIVDEDNRLAVSSTYALKRLPLLYRFLSCYDTTTRHLSDHGVDHRHRLQLFDMIPREAGFARRRYVD